MILNIRLTWHTLSIRINDDTFQSTAIFILKNAPIFIGSVNILKCHQGPLYLFKYEAYTSFSLWGAKTHAIIKTTFGMRLYPVSAGQILITGGPSNILFYPSKNSRGLDKWQWGRLSEDVWYLLLLKQNFNLSGLGFIKGVSQRSADIFIYLFGVLCRFQHCTGHITTGSWKGRGNQYIQLVKVLYCKLPINGKQLPAFPLEAVPGIEPRTQRWEARVLPLCHHGPYQRI